MNLKTLEARIRQIHAADKNALIIYEDLMRQAPDDATRTILESLARDERRHEALGRAILKIIESRSG